MCPSKIHPIPQYQFRKSFINRHLSCFLCFYAIFNIYWCILFIHQWRLTICGQTNVSGCVCVWGSNRIFIQMPNSIKHRHPHARTHSIGISHISSRIYATHCTAAPLVSEKLSTLIKRWGKNIVTHHKQMHWW